AARLPGDFLRSLLCGLRARLFRLQGRLGPRCRERVPESSIKRCGAEPSGAYPNLIYFNEVDKGNHSRPGRSRTSSRTRFGPRSGTCVDRRAHKRTEVLMSSNVETATEIRRFHVDIPDEALEDLRRRIAATHWPEKETVADQSQGVPLAMIQELARYW